MVDFQTTGAERLLALADILDVADEQHRKRKEPGFTMGAWAHPSCGTPACAMGHWAASEEGSKRWYLSGYNLVYKQGDMNIAHLTNEVCIKMADEFGITSEERGKLFNSSGCGCAKTAKEAADYIRNFVFEKLKCSNYQGDNS